MALETSPFDPAEYLDTPEAIAGFLGDIFDSGDDALIASALEVVARTKIMMEAAHGTSMPRHALDQALVREGRPEFGVVLRLLSAVGVTLKPTVAA